MIKKTDFLTLDLPGKYRIPSIDYFRTIAIFLVILMHNMHKNPLLGAFGRYTDGGGGAFLEAILEFVLSHIFTLAVPFFFVIAGYFFGQKIMTGDSSARTLGTYSGRLMLALFFWRIVYFFIPSPSLFEHSHDYLGWIYGKVTDVHELSELLNIRSVPHLWFIPALLIALCTATFFSSVKRQWMFLPFAILLYLLYLTKSTYATTSWGAQANTFFQLCFPPWVNAWTDVTVNYFYPIVFVSGGWYLTAKKIEFKVRTSVLFILSGVFISSLEIMLLYKECGIVSSCLIGTVPLVIGVAMLAFSMPDIGKDSFMSKCGRYAFGIYLIHYLFVFWLRPLADLFEYPFSEIVHFVVVYFFSLVVIVVLSKNKWLRRVVV